MGRQLLSVLLLCCAPLWFSEALKIGAKIRPLEFVDHYEAKIIDCRRYIDSLFRVTAASAEFLPPLENRPFGIVDTS